MGVAYAAFYMARYNVAAGNVSALIRVLSAGSWAYAVSGPLTGQMTDSIGGKNGILVACLGAALCNLSLGVLFLCKVPFIVEQVLFVVLYATNVLVQGFGTSAVVKINAAWYSASERGIFAGVFNIMLTSGYYLSLGTGSSIIGTLGWAYVFAIPGAVLFVMALVISCYVTSSPADTHNFSSELLPATVIQTNNQRMSSADDEGDSDDEGDEFYLTPKQQMQQLMRNYTFLGYLGAVFFLCWARDGFLNWFFSFFDAVRAEPLTSSDTAIIGGAWTMGGFVGGILCGWLSDVIFHSDRIMPIFIFSLLQAVVLGIIYVMSATCSVIMLGGLVFFSSVFLLHSAIGFIAGYCCRSRWCDDSCRILFYGAAWCLHGMNIDTTLLEYASIFNLRMHAAKDNETIFFGVSMFRSPVRGKWLRIRVPNSGFEILQTFLR
ncbi:unnamed protein product [Phytophthora fragariaefolia]|uniref:Unnamed protein product n=1 Tax=Phytophthora fragariaefolia TaxID=1490495 RepID=A0A9W7DB18_9STRA|nr:unnamed protein product [Phytophthora fragariaefolia]